MSEEIGLRASDADRERTATALRDAAAAGRLSADELEERLETAFGARDHSQLAALVADLPRESRPAPGGPPVRLTYQRQVFVGAAVLMVAIWALAGAGYFWPIWPIMGWGVCAFGPWAGRRRRPASRPDTLRSCPPSASSTS